MKAFKLFLTEIKEENMWGQADKDAIKRGKVAFPIKLKIEDEEVSFKKGDEVGYQYGNRAVVNGEELIQVSANSISWQK